MLSDSFCFPSRETARLLSRLSQHQLVPPQITGLSNSPPSPGKGIIPDRRPLPASPRNGLVTQKKEIVSDCFGKASSQLPRGERGAQGPCRGCRALAGGKEPGRLQEQATACRAGPGLCLTPAGAHHCTGTWLTQGGAQGPPITPSLPRATPRCSK